MIIGIVQFVTIYIRKTLLVIKRIVYQWVLILMVAAVGTEVS